jgi:hypothetical protein
MQIFRPLYGEKSSEKLNKKAVQINLNGFFTPHS